MALRRNLIGNFVGQGWVAAMSLAFVPVYIGQLGVEAYALIGLYAVIQGWLSILDLGMTPTLNREMARASAGAHTANQLGDLVRSIEIVCFSVAAVITGSIWLSSGWLADHWFEPEMLGRDVIASAFIVMALVVGSRFCEGIYRGALFGMERQVWYNSANAVLATLRYGGAAAIITWISSSIVAFFLWQAAISLLTVVVMATATHCWMPRADRPARFSPPALKAIAVFAGGLSLTALVGLLLTHADKIMLSRILSLDQFGHYMLAVAVTSLFPMLILPVASAFYPSLTRAVTAGDDAAVVQRYRLAAQLAAFLLAPAMAVCVLMPEALILAWTDDAALAQQVGPLLRFLSIGVVANSLLQIPYSLQLAHGWTDLAIKINCVTAAIMLPLEFFAAQQYGDIGAAVVWGCINATVLPAATLLMHRRLLPAEQWKWVWYGVLVPVASGLVPVAVLAWLLPAASSRWSALLSVAGAGLCALLVVAFALPELRRMLYGRRHPGMVARNDVGGN